MSDRGHAGENRGRDSSRCRADRYHSRLGWKDFARGGFEAHCVPGRHDSMFTAENVGPMSAILRSLL